MTSSIMYPLFGLTVIGFIPVICAQQSTISSTDRSVYFRERRLDRFHTKLS